MTRASELFTGLALTALLGLAGCAAATPESAPPGEADGATAPMTTVPYSCETAAEPIEVLLGDTLTVSRGPDGPCEGLEPGTTQTFRFGPEDTVAFLDVPVAEDGSFSFEFTVPADMAIGRTWLQWIPADPACDTEGVLDCPPPGVNFSVIHPPSALQETTIVSTELRPPSSGAGEGCSSNVACVVQGPAPGQLTVVMIGPGCPTVPRYFVATARSGSLELVGDVEGDMCIEPRLEWLNVIEIPDGFAGFTSVKVDNVPAPMIPAP